MPPIPTAPDHTWHTPYLRALEISGVPEPKRQWFVGWVERFAKFLVDKPLHAADRNDAEAFFRSLESIRRIEPWRLRQASDAVRLLLTAIFGKRWDADATVPVGNTLEVSADPLRRACRARGYSPRTEASYATGSAGSRCSDLPSGRRSATPTLSASSLSGSHWSSESPPRRRRRHSTPSRSGSRTPLGRFLAIWATSQSRNGQRSSPLS